MARRRYYFGGSFPKAPKSPPPPSRHERAEHEGRVPQVGVPSGPRQTVPALPSSPAASKPVYNPQTRSYYHPTPPAPTPAPSLLQVSDLLTPGPTAKETAEAAHRLGVTPQDATKGIAEGIGAAASALTHTASHGVKEISQDVADLPKQRVHSVLGRKTLGTPTVAQVAGALVKGQTRVNQRGKLTIPATRRAARTLAGARQAVRKSSGGDGSVESQVGRYLLNHGLNKKAVAGILGNAYAESSLDPSAQGYGGGGLWGFTAHPNSLSDLQSYAASQGRAWTDPKVQSAFLMRHVSPETVQQLNASPTPEAAAATFMSQFERPGIPRQDVREGAARDALASGKWGKPDPQALANLKQAKLVAQRQGIPTQAGDVEPGPQPHTVFVRADAEGFVHWAKALLGTQEGSKLQVKWAAEAGMSPAEAWCSEFIAAGIRRRGLTPPPGYPMSDAWTRWNQGTDIGSDISKAKPGDILVIGGNQHVGLYVGGGRMIAGNWSDEVSEYNVADDSRGVSNIIRPHFSGKKVAVKESTVLPGAALGPGGEILSGPAGVGGAEATAGTQQQRTTVAPSLGSVPVSPLLATSAPLPAAFQQDQQGTLESLSPEEVNDMVASILRRKRL